MKILKKIIIHKHIVKLIFLNKWCMFSKTDKLFIVQNVLQDFLVMQHVQQKQDVGILKIRS